MRACLRNGWLSSRARDAELAVGDDDLDPLVAQDPEAPAGGVLGRIIGGDDDAADAGAADRLGARRRAALVAARLQRHVQRRAAEVVVGGGEDRLHLRVRTAQRAVEALAEDLLVARDDRADHAGSG